MTPPEQPEESFRILYARREHSGDASLHIVSPAERGGPVPVVGAMRRALLPIALALVVSPPAVADCPTTPPSPLTNGHDDSRGDDGLRLGRHCDTGCRIEATAKANPSTDLKSSYQQLGKVAAARPAPRSSSPPCGRRRTSALSIRRRRHDSEIPESWRSERPAWPAPGRTPRPDGGTQADEGRARGLLLEVCYHLSAGVRTAGDARRTFGSFDSLGISDVVLPSLWCDHRG